MSDVDALVARSRAERDALERALARMRDSTVSCGCTVPPVVNGRCVGCDGIRRAT